MVEVTQRYGNRRVPRMYAKVEELRQIIRKEGTPAIQEAWDQIEPIIDYSYGVIGKLDAPSECQPTIAVFDAISKHEQTKRLPCLSAMICQMVSKVRSVLRSTL